MAMPLLGGAFQMAASQPVSRGELWKPRYVLVPLLGVT